MKKAKTNACLNGTANVGGIRANTVQQRRRSALVKMLALCMVLACGIPGAYADESRAEITVRGEATVNAKADLVKVQIGITTTSEDSAKAMKQNADKAKKVEKALQKAGLNQDEYSTSQYYVQPRFEPRTVQQGQNAVPKIIGYVVSNTLTVSTKRIDKIGAIIGAATDAGANRVDSLIFDVDDPQPYREQAIKLATEKSKRDAKVLADAAGVKLTRITSMQLDYFNIAPIRFAQAATTARMAMESTAPPISAGEIEIRAAVIMKYEIGN